VLRRASRRPSTRCGSGIGDRPLYVSVDIDVLDPAHAPAPYPRGRRHDQRELLEILRGWPG